MAYAFTTESHACYKIENGRISRIGESKIYDKRACAFVEIPIMDEPFTFEEAPTPGKHFEFRLKSEAHMFGDGPTVTSKVSGVYPIVHVELVDTLPSEEELEGALLL